MSFLRSSTLSSRENRREFVDSLISEDILRSKHRSYSNLHDYPTQDTLRLSQEHHIPQYHAEQPMIYDYDNYKKLQYQFSITEGEKQRAEEDYVRRTEIHLKSIFNLSNQVEQLELGLDHKRRENERAIVESERLMEERNNLIDTLRRVQDENESLVSSLDMLREEYAGVKQELANREKESVDHQEEGTKLQISLDKLKGENDALRDDNNRLNEELANLKKESGEIVSIHQQIAADTEDYREKMNYHRQLQEETTGACSALEQKNERLRDEVEELRRHIADYQERVHEEEKSKLSAHNQILELECRVRDKDFLLRECKEELDVLDQAMQRYLSDNAALKAKLQQIEDTKESHEKATRDLADFYERVNYEDSRIKELVQERKTLEDSREEMKYDIFTAQSKIKALLNIS